ncbi:SAP9 [Candida oxycetoniae]|uniref:candidapepsin n=1 Tax=Candida oxycetoniae TaxID=497107 RepID=A0AAI9WXG9_9ASCO|nr:SAP9 [Candida oxycetoniae]KAI3403989.2 SAP9 [Candida oxycetoniae]
MKFTVQLASLLAALYTLVPLAEAITAPPAPALNVKKRHQENYYKMDFNIRRGSSRSDLSPVEDSAPRLVKRDDPDGSFELVLSNQQTFYMADLYIGSNQELNQVLVDTGSSDLWVMSHDLRCLATNYKKKRDAKNVFQFGTGVQLVPDSMIDKEKRDAKNVFQFGTGVQLVPDSMIDKEKRDAKNVFQFSTGVQLVPDSMIDEKRQEQNNEIDKKRQEQNDEDQEPTKVVRDDAIYTTIYLTGGSFFTGLPDFFSSLLPGGSGGSSGSSSSSSSGSTSTSTRTTNSGGTNSCTSNGSFNTGDSDTFVKNNTGAFSIQYADGSHAIGIWGYDNIRMGDVTVSNVSFAVANETSSNIGVLGIGLPGLERTTEYNYMYENLPMKLKSDGIINRVAYSLYLAKADDKSGSILFGAVDHAKYEGSLVTVPMLRTYQVINYPVRFEVEVSNIVFNNSGNTETVLSDSIGAVLDSGSTLSYLRSDQIKAVASQLDGQYVTSAGFYLVDCDYLNSDTTLDITFVNKTIRVPVSDLIFRVSSRQCGLGLWEQSSGSPYILFGDNVLRSAYIVYDLENYAISLAQAYYTDEEDVEVITDSVPLPGGQNSTSVGGGSSSSSSSSSSSGNRQSLAVTYQISFISLIFGFIITISIIL